jgi:GT2 family glycosyltransferase
MQKIKFVIATRLSEKDFHEKSATGKCLQIYRFPFVQIRLFPENTQGLPKLYNIAIEESKNDPCILIFCHDDLHLLDFFWFEIIIKALNDYQIVGLVGNKRRVPKQPAWAFVGKNNVFDWDTSENLSGTVGYGNTFPPANISMFGRAPQKVKLLDGLFLAVSSKTLIEHNLKFDERFDFHFYDMDICRQAELAGIDCGTCTMSVIHESQGSFGSDSWRKAYVKYLEKWGE